MAPTHMCVYMMTIVNKDFDEISIIALFRLCNLIF